MRKHINLEDIYCTKEKGSDLYEIKNGYRPMNKISKSCKDYIDISPQINKLFDHVNLDIARIQYMKKIELQTLESKDELSNVLKSANELKQNVDNIQKEYITILGIFSSIVLAFVSGITFSSSVLENIANSNVYRTLAVVIILGFIFLNIINILVQFIISISSKESTKKKSNTYITYINITLGIIFLLIILAWFFDFKLFADVIRRKLYIY